MTNDTTTIVYDSLYPVQIVAPGGVINKFVVNALGWMTKRYDVGDTLSISYRYDSAGRMTSFTNRRGQVVSRTYDALDRITGQSGTNVPSDTYTYSTSGDTLTAWRPNVSRDSLYLNKAGHTDSLIRKIAGQRCISGCVMGRLFGDGVATRRRYVQNVSPVDPCAGPRPDRDPPLSKYHPA